jgi:hypothetical protein
MLVIIPSAEVYIRQANTSQGNKKSMTSATDRNAHAKDPPSREKTFEALLVAFRREMTMLPSDPLFGYDMPECQHRKSRILT